MVNRVSIGGTIDYEHESAQYSLLLVSVTKYLVVFGYGELVNRPLAVNASILGHFTLRYFAMTYDDFAT